MDRKLRPPGVALAILIPLLASIGAFGKTNPEGVSLVVGPPLVSACEDEPLFLEVDFVNGSSQEIRFILMPRDWRFDIARENGELLAEHIFPYPGGMESYVKFSVGPGESVSFDIPFPVLLRGVEGVDGKTLRIGPGNYVVTWHCNEDRPPLLEPYSEEDPRTWPWLVGSGTFRFEVEKRNEQRLAEAWGGIRDRFLQYESRWKNGFRDPQTSLEWTALAYTLDAVEDEFALPYLESMKAVDDKEMKRAPDYATRKIQFNIERYGHSPVSPEEKRRKVREKMEQQDPP